MSNIDPSEWPDSNIDGLTDEQALIVAHLIIDQKPRSYVEGAIRLAKYVIALRIQAKEIEDLIDEERRDTERKIPVAIPVP